MICSESVPAANKSRGSMGSMSADGLGIDPPHVLYHQRVDGRFGLAAPAGFFTGTVELNTPAVIDFTFCTTSAAPTAGGASVVPYRCASSTRSSKSTFP